MTALMLAAFAGCNDFLQVDNTSTVDAGSIDPAQDATTLSNSSLQDFAAIYSSLAMYDGWFTGATIASETFQGPNDFSRRQVLNNDGDITTVFSGIATAIVSSGKVIDVLKNAADASTNIDLARVEFVSGYSFEFMAEDFCVGTARSGPALDSAAMLDSAQAHFTNAIAIGTANGTPAGVAFANAALVGRARSELQEGNKTAALADAQQVPEGFEYDVQYFNDNANLTRVGNQLWARTFGRGSISVAPAYRTLNDPRVPVVPPGQSFQGVNFTPQDGVTPFYAQVKFASYASPIRLASRLEADYIVAEASGNAAELDLINTRRSANGQPAYSGPTDDASVLTELMTQKTLDFYLEGKRLGDFRRNGSAVLNMPVPGTPYFKTNGYGPIGDQTCYILPIGETSNNPNLQGQ
jgi:hypothetical protein